MIQVTAAIIHNDGKLLLCQKPKGKRCELLWEFPGGKIGEPKCIEHNDVRWFTLDDILKMPLCPADRKMFNQSFDKIKMYLATREI